MQTEQQPLVEKSAESGTKTEAKNSEKNCDVSTEKIASIVEETKKSTETVIKKESFNSVYSALLMIVFRAQ